MRGYIPSIAFFGDSITEGMSPYLGPECARQIGGKLRVGVYARSGSSVKDWVQNRWPEELSKQFHPNLVVLALGTNPQEADEYEYAGLMQRACGGSQAGGAARCIVVGPFALDDRGRRNGALYGAFPGRSVVNGYHLAQTLPRDGEGDVHFTPAGYSALAKRLVQWIVPAAVRVRRPGASLAAVLLPIPGAATIALLAERWL